MDKTTKGNITYFKKDGIIQSFLPPESYFGYTYHALLIPPFRPTNVLILGYGGGVVSLLIKKIWGDTPVTGIDLEEQAQHGDNFIKADAYEWIKNNKRVFDYVVIDLFNGPKTPDFVFDYKFIKHVARSTGKLLAINVWREDETKPLGYHLNGFKTDLFKELMGNVVIFLVKNGVNSLKVAND